jgi:hypothetical protein
MGSVLKPTVYDDTSSITLSKSIGYVASRHYANMHTHNSRPVEIP